MNDSGSMYVGQWSSDKREGTGRLVFACGDVYEGEVVKESLHGSGTYTHSNGDVYTGEFADNLPHGQGVMSFAVDSFEFPADAGDRYEGGWLAGKMHGEGTYFYASGDRYEGEYRAGERHGPGTLFYADGRAEVGRPGCARMNASTL